MRRCARLESTCECEICDVCCACGSMARFSFRSRNGLKHDSFRVFDLVSVTFEFRFCACVLSWVEILECGLGLEPSIFFLSTVLIVPDCSRLLRARVSHRTARSHGGAGAHQEALDGADS